MPSGRDGRVRARPGVITFTHTEVDDAYEGQGLGGTLARYALDDARARGLEVRPLCPFIGTGSTARGLPGPGRPAAWIDPTPRWLHPPRSRSGCRRGWPTASTAPGSAAPAGRTRTRSRRPTRRSPAGKASGSSTLSVPTISTPTSSTHDRDQWRPPGRAGAAGEHDRGHDIDHSGQRRQQVGQRRLAEPGGDLYAGPGASRPGRRPRRRRSAPVPRRCWYGARARSARVMARPGSTAAAAAASSPATASRRRPAPPRRTGSAPRSPRTRRPG